MALDLVDYEQNAREAVKAFWGNREAARQKQIDRARLIKVNEPVLPLAKTWTGSWPWCSTSSRPMGYLMPRYTRTGQC